MNEINPDGCSESVIYVKIKVDDSIAECKW